jgi:arginyl-tRNA synthetase
VEPDAIETTPDVDLLDSPEERELLRQIGRFPAVIEDAADELHPHQVATYTREFAEAFNAFYRECPVLDSDTDEATQQTRLALVVAARTTVGNALDVLGVDAPDSM